MSDDPLLNILLESLRRILDAEKSAPAGSYEHSQRLGAQLMSEWPIIRAFVLSHVEDTPPMSGLPRISLQETSDKIGNLKT